MHCIGVSSSLLATRFSLSFYSFPKSDCPSERAPLLHIGKAITWALTSSFASLIGTRTFSGFLSRYEWQKPINSPLVTQTSTQIPTCYSFTKAEATHQRNTPPLMVRPRLTRRTPPSSRARSPDGSSKQHQTTYIKTSACM